MKTINIKGKDYVEVNERVKYFRDNYKDWSIETELISNEDGVCVFKALIKDPQNNIKSSGYAYEKENSSFINKTSYIENCETSAVGRALGFLGIGIDASIASCDEVINAMNNQQERQVSNNRIDFNEVKQKLAGIGTTDQLDEYWKTLKPSSQKQVDALTKMFKERKEQING